MIESLGYQIVSFLAIVVFIIIIMSISDLEVSFWISIPFIIYFSVELIIRLRLFGAASFNCADV